MPDCTACCAPLEELLEDELLLEEELLDELLDEELLDELEVEELLELPPGGGDVPPGGAPPAPHAANATAKSPTATPRQPIAPPLFISIEDQARLWRGCRVDQPPDVNYVNCISGHLPDGGMRGANIPLAPPRGDEPPLAKAIGTPRG